MENTKLIDSLDQLSEMNFNETYYNKKPVIVKLGIKEIGCFQRWDTEYLKNRIGNKTVNVACTDKGSYNYAIKDIKWISGTFSELMDLFESGQESHSFYYLAQSSIPAHFPELLSDLKIPEFIAEDDIVEKQNLWIGCAGCDSGLHYDNSHNFFYQVRGTKEMAFFSPEDGDFLYPSKREGKWHMSEIELHNFDKERFKLFPKAQQFNCVVEPGDMVYIPPGWWHNVLSVTMSVSVNYWWHRFDVPSGRGIKMFSVQAIYSFLEEFLKRGKQIDHYTSNGETLLMKAIDQGHANFVEALLLNGANPNTLSNVVSPGTSALEFARWKEEYGITKLLLKYGAIEIKKVAPSK